MTTPNPGGDGELLRDAIARAYANFMGCASAADPLPVPDEADFQIANVALAALRTVLREHPEAIRALGWTCSPDGYFPPIALGHSQGADT